MAQHEYKWRPGFRCVADAQAVGERIERIRRRTGGALGAADVVEDATKDRGSPLRPCFEWDNRAAAEQFRLHQARNVISALRTVKFEGRVLERPVRTMVIMGPARNVAEPVDRPYVGVEELTNPHYRARILANLLRAIENIERDFQDLIDFLDHDFGPLKASIAERLSEDGLSPPQ